MQTMSRFWGGSSRMWEGRGKGRERRGRRGMSLVVGGEGMEEARGCPSLFSPSLFPPPPLSIEIFSLPSRNILEINKTCDFQGGPTQMEACLRLGDEGYHTWIHCWPRPDPCPLPQQRRRSRLESHRPALPPRLLAGTRAGAWISRGSTGTWYSGRRAGLQEAVAVPFTLPPQKLFPHTRQKTRE